MKCKAQNILKLELKKRIFNFFATMNFSTIVNKFLCDKPTNQNNKAFVDDGKLKNIGMQP